MNPIVAQVSIKCGSRWSRRRWTLTIGSLFVVQLAMVFLLQEVKAAKPAPRPHINYHFEPSVLTSRQIAHYFFTTDPTLYSSASLHSFSGPAWLRFEFPRYDFPPSKKQVNWLDINMNQLGQTPDSSGRFSNPLQTLTVASPKVESFLNYLAPDTARTQSVVTLEGNLAQRVLQIPKNLPPRTASDMISNSVVELAADGRGQVISTRLTGRCGSPDADREALKIARNLVFAPVSADVGGEPVSWGTLIFQWQAILPPDTNAPPKL